MPEEIKVVLEADASQLTAEFKKAQAIAGEFGKKTLPLVEASLNAGWAQQKKLTQAMATGRKGLQDYSGGMLQLAQTADDAQYGLRGVLNNIPGLVMGFGAGAGLAGAISLAVLAAAKLGPLLKDIYGDGEIEKINRVTAAVAKRYDEEISKLRELAREREITAEVAGLTRDIATFAAQNLRIQDYRLKGLEDERKALELQRRLQDEIATARGGQDTGEQRVSRLQKDLSLAREEARRSSAEFARIEADASSVNAILASSLSAARAEVERLTRNIAGGRANVAGAEEGVKNGVPGSLSALGYAQRRLAVEEDALKVQQQRVKQLEEEMSVAAGMSKTMLSTLADRIDGAIREGKALEQQIPVYQELVRLAKERAAATEEERLNAELEARRQSQWELKTRGDGLPPAAVTPAAEEKSLRIQRERQALMEQARRTAAAVSRIGGDRPGSGLRRVGLERSGGLRISGLRASAEEIARQKRAAEGRNATRSGDPDISAIRAATEDTAKSLQKLGLL